MVSQTDLVALIVSAQHGVLYPYRYANHFERSLPPHLFPSEREAHAIKTNGNGTFKTRSTSKFMSKIRQLRKEPRSLAAHLFYTPNHKHWYLFYFDNRDVSRANNHWKHGSHIHLVSSLWPNLKMAKVWSDVQRGKLDFSNKIHIRYKRR